MPNVTIKRGFLNDIVNRRKGRAQAALYEAKLAEMQAQARIKEQEAMRMQIEQQIEMQVRNGEPIYKLDKTKRNTFMIILIANGNPASKTEYMDWQEARRVALQMDGDTRQEIKDRIKNQNTEPDTKLDSELARLKKQVEIAKLKQQLAELTGDDNAKQL